MPLFGRKTEFEEPRHKPEPKGEPAPAVSKLLEKVTGRPNDAHIDTEVATPEAEEASVGLYGKFYVERADGRDRPGRSREHARYFVLDYVHDPAARRALYAYAKKLEALGTDPELAQDLYEELEDTEALFEHFGKG